MIVSERKASAPRVLSARVRDRLPLLDQRPGDLDEAIRLIERRGALAETLARARGYAAAAIDAQAMFRDGAARRALIEAAVFATERGF